MKILQTPAAREKARGAVAWAEETRDHAEARLEEIATILDGVDERLPAAIRTETEAADVAALQELYRRIHVVMTAAAHAGIQCRRVLQAAETEDEA